MAYVTSRTIMQIKQFRRRTFIDIHFLNHFVRLFFVRNTHKKKTLVSTIIIIELVFKYLFFNLGVMIKFIRTVCTKTITASS